MGDVARTWMNRKKFKSGDTQNPWKTGISCEITCATSPEDQGRPAGRRLELVAM